jgi:hypothetical protein
MRTQSQHVLHGHRTTGRLTSTCHPILHFSARLPTRAYHPRQHRAGAAQQCGGISCCIWRSSIIQHQRLGRCKSAVKTLVVIAAAHGTPAGFRTSARDGAGLLSRLSKHNCCFTCCHSRPHTAAAGLMILLLFGALPHTAQVIVPHAGETCSCQTCSHAHHTTSDSDQHPSG